jgi:flagellar motor switch protein FliN/FliY
MENTKAGNEQNTSPSTPAMEDDWAAAMAEQQQTKPDLAESDLVRSDKEDGENTVSQEYQPAEFQDLKPSVTQQTNTDTNMDLVLDILVTIALEIGRAKISIRDLLKLHQGSIVELDRLIGEPLDVLVNGTLIAHGEVVTVKEKFGIRLTDVVSPTERVRKLK